MTGFDHEIFRDTNTEPNLPIVVLHRSAISWQLPVRDVYLPGDKKKVRALPIREAFGPFDDLPPRCQACSTDMPWNAVTSFDDDGVTFYVCLDTAACEARRAGRVAAAARSSEHSSSFLIGAVNRLMRRVEELEEWRRTETSRQEGTPRWQREQVAIEGGAEYRQWRWRRGSDGEAEG